MFCAQEVLRTQCVVSRGVAANEKPLEKDEFKVNFMDGKHAIYSIHSLIGLNGVRAILNSSDTTTQGASSKEFRDKEISFPNHTQEMLNVVFSLVVGKEPFYEVLSEESFTNPFLFEEICDLIQYFHPEEDDATILKLKTYQIPYMPLEIAKKVLEGFTCMKEIEPERFLNEKKEAIEPELVKIAKKIVFEAIFLAEEEVTEHFNAVRELHQEIDACEEMKNSLLERNKTPKNETEKYLLLSQMGGFVKTIETLTKKLTQLNEKTDFKQVSMKTKQRVSLLVNHFDPRIKEVALQAKQELDRYIESIKEALKRCEADMTRTDLLEYLIGPKEYLFDEYGLIPRNEDSEHEPEFAFKHKLARTVPFRYTLDRDGPAYLEDEIREDMEQFLDSENIPERFIKVRTYTRPISEKILQMQKEFLPLLNKWNSPEIATTEAKLKLFKVLIEHNEWQQFEIKPEDLSFDDVKEGEIKPSTHISGRVKVSTRTAKFKFKVSDFSLLVPSSNNPLNPDKASSLRKLAKVKQGYESIGDRTQMIIPLSDDEEEEGEVDDVDGAED